MISPIFLPAWDSLTFLARSPFFLLWNLGVILFIILLNFITFFDFEGESIPELFFSTIVLSGALNATVFHLSLSRTPMCLDLLLFRPVKTSKIVVGRFLGLMTFQAALSALLITLQYLLTMLLGREVPPAFFGASALAIVQVGMLSALIGLLVVWLDGFWALTAIVTVYLIGHLSHSMMEALPASLSGLAGLIFCLIPDLELFIGNADNIKSHFNLMFWELTYSILYIILIVCFWSYSLSFKVFKVRQ
jgi:hypothetical protein